MSSESKREYIRCCLSVSSNAEEGIDLDVIPFIPTHKWSKGEPVMPKSTLVHENSGYSICQEDHQSIDVEEVLIALLNRINTDNHKSYDFRLNPLGLNLELQITIYVKDVAPSIGFSLSTLGRICDLRAALDVDIIFVP